MIDGTLRNRISSIRNQTFELFNDIADKRDDLPQGDKHKAQYRAVARILEEGLVRIEQALDKARQ